MTKKLFVNGGRYSLVDDDDYLFLQNFSWNASGRGDYIYAFFRYRMDGQTKYCSHFLHSIVNQTPKGKQTDHINGIRYDNRKCNLRTVTPAQNCANSHITLPNSTGIPGVFAQVRHKKIVYRSRIEIDGKTVNLGYFKTPEEAGAAYKAAKEKRKLELFGPSESGTPQPDPETAKERGYAVMQNV